MPNGMCVFFGYVMSLFRCFQGIATCMIHINIISPLVSCFNYSPLSIEYITYILWLFWGRVGEILHNNALVFPYEEKSVKVLRGFSVFGSLWLVDSSPIVVPTERGWRSAILLLSSLGFYVDLVMGKINRELFTHTIDSKLNSTPAPKNT